MKIVGCASHRARQRLFCALGRTPPAVWHLHKGTHYGSYEINDEELPKARSVKGISQIHGDAEEWMYCH